MVTPKTDADKISHELEELRKRIEDLFILQATLAGVGQRQITAMLGIDRRRVSRLAKHVKKES